MDPVNSERRKIIQSIAKSFAFGFCWFPNNLDTILQLLLYVIHYTADIGIKLSTWLNE